MDKDKLKKAAVLAFGAGIVLGLKPGVASADTECQYSFGTDSNGDMWDCTNCSDGTNSWGECVSYPYDHVE